MGRGTEGIKNKEERLETRGGYAKEGRLKEGQKKIHHGL
jgi:hypothetical protein